MNLVEYISIRELEDIRNNERVEKIYSDHNTFHNSTFGWEYPLC